MIQIPSQKFWKDKKVLVTGGTGFIGSHVVKRLLDLGAQVSVLDRRTDGKIKNIAYLKDRVNFIKGDCTNPDDAYIACKKQEIVLNLAARVGSITYNMTHQGTMMRDNLLISVTMLDAALKAKVERFLVVSAACIYPRNCKIPTPETEGFVSEPEPTNGGYGWAKRMSELLGKYYQEEFGMKIGIVRPYNCYGPRDNFDPKVSHVIPGLIKRVLDGENPIVVWGSGKQTRAFLYVEDLVEGMLLTIERYPVADAINLGMDEEVSIGELINKIVRIAEMKTSIVFDTTKSDGSPRKNSDNTKAKKLIGFVAKTKLDEGLKKTIFWYKEKLSEGYFKGDLK